MVSIFKVSRKRANNGSYELVFEYSVHLLEIKNEVLISTHSRDRQTFIVIVESAIIFS